MLSPFTMIKLNNMRRRRSRRPQTPKVMLGFLRWS